MGISFYTSRVVLAQLGIDDFGVYNVVGGVVSMFAVLNSAMTSSTQRYITIELGRHNTERLKQVFNTSLQIHLIISIGVALITEVFGLWFLHNKMQIPPESMSSADWVFQLSVLSMIISFINVPYTALIIAYERMGAFAYISILEVLLKLASAFLLAIAPFEKLKFYAILMFVCPIIIRICYWWYCKKNFEESRLRFIYNLSLFKEMVQFAGWGLFGQLAGMGATQGLNILLNVFFGPAVNAARGVAVQVQAAISQFALNFQTAVNPQITKTYASEDFNQMHALIFRSAKFSFILLYSLGLPVVIEAPAILHIWLEEVPDYTVQFLRVIIFITIIDSVANPLMVAAAASGNIKKYQSVVGGLLLLIIPIAYIALKMGASPISVFIVHLIVCIIAFISRLYIVKPLVRLQPRYFLSVVVMRCLYVALLSALVSATIYYCLPIGNIPAICVCILSSLSVLVVSYYIGLDKSEKEFSKKLLFKVLRII